MIRWAAIFTGRVQGVGFRATAASIARDHPVSGWVRNEPDGRVRLEAQGEEAAVRRFVGVISETFGGRIVSLDVTEMAVIDGEQGFRVRR